MLTDGFAIRSRISSTTAARQVGENRTGLDARGMRGATPPVRSSPTLRAAIVLKFSERMLGGAEHSGGHHEAARHSCGTSPFVSSFLRGENSRHLSEAGHE